MRKPENTFVVGVHKYLPSQAELHREKMNNPYSRNTADWWYSGQVRDLWVEYKFMRELPKRDTTVVVPNLSDGQRDWCTKRFEEGRDVLVVLGYKNGAVMFPEPEAWLTGFAAGECRESTITRQELAALITAHCQKGSVIVTRHHSSSEVRSSCSQGS